MKTIIFGGSFDPIHNGHLLIAHNAYQALNADQVVFVLSGQARFKDQPVSYADRRKMLELALAHCPWATISDLEQDAPKAGTTTIDTLQRYHKLYPDEQLYMLIGADQANQFEKWIEPEKIATISQIIVYQRAGSPLNADNVNRYHMQIIPGELSEAASKDVRYLQGADVDLQVLDYIRHHRLYFYDRLLGYIDEKRLEHSFEVARLAYQIAKINHLDYSKAYIAAILHDIGKNVDPLKRHALMEEHYKEYLPLPKWLHHQFIGAYIAKTDFGIDDPLILDAIAYHATGAGQMSWLAKVLYSADKIEISRGFNPLDLIEACLRDYESGFRTVLQANKEFLMSKGLDVSNPLTVACFNSYLKENEK